MRIAGVLFCMLVYYSCSPSKDIKTQLPSLNELAVKYVKLGLSIGAYDSDFVDAYYGPDSLKPQFVKQQEFPKDSFLMEVTTLQNQLRGITDTTDKQSMERIAWMNDQLVAFSRRIRIFAGEKENFDIESKELFGVVAPVFPEAHFQQLVQQLDSILPGSGSISERFQQVANRFVLPVNKTEAVFKEAIKEARKITLANYKLPDTESFSLEFVKNKPWSGYNWYKGNYNSLIQINTDNDIYVERAIDLACHEGYPGHHLYNMLLEKNLYRDKGWVEISLYPLFSPQSLIAEGSANYGIDLAFPDHEQLAYTRDILLPLAGLDTTGVHLYFQALQLKGKLNYARNEVARGIVNGSMAEEEAMRWLVSYSLFSEEAAVKSISFIRKYRSYVINYNYGLDLVRSYMDRMMAKESDNNRWQVFSALLSNPVTISKLTGEEN